MTRQEISRSNAVAMLDAWAGEAVAVRLIADGDLLAVFHGVIGDRSRKKEPAAFWPLLVPEATEPARHLEQPGIYLHEEAFQGAAIHVGNQVLELHQHGVMLNLRRL